MDTECPTKKVRRPRKTTVSPIYSIREGPLRPTGGQGPTPTLSPLGLGCAPPWVVAPSWRGGLQQATMAGSPPKPRASCPLKRGMPVLPPHPPPPPSQRGADSDTREPPGQRAIYKGVHHVHARYRGGETKHSNAPLTRQAPTVTPLGLALPWLSSCIGAAPATAEGGRGREGRRGPPRSGGPSRRVKASAAAPRPQPRRPRRFTP